MTQYAIGVDFGTLSARALAVEIGTGRELASASMDYPHGVMSRALPDGTPLRPDWALQHPGDYAECLRAVVRETLRRAQLDPANAAGLGVDFTANTFLPVNAHGDPLCLQPEWQSNPHAWAKLWKHHAAQPFATRMEDAARARGEQFLERYGGKVSPEWMLPKLWQILEEAPEVCEAADCFIEAGDWIVRQLTGSDARSASIAGYKAFYDPQSGYPMDYLRALDPRLARLTEEKLQGRMLPPGARAGVLNARGAEWTGLPEGVPVAVANIDAHVSMPAAGPTEPGDMLMILGTSACHIMLGSEQRSVPGICGAVLDGVLPGMVGYEAGQNCCGDHFHWIVDHFAPARYAQEAERRGISLHELLTEKAAALKPGESGLLALDWWNGNRSVLVDANLTGLLLGMTLSTRCEEIYRALMEAVAFGARKILDAFEESGTPVRKLYACGGIAQKNPLMMQILADVLRREIRIVRSAQASALGSAMFGAVAAGSAQGGYDSITDAAREMGGVDARIYAPDPENSRVYDALYREYSLLHDAFGRDQDVVMKRLRRLRDAQLSRSR